MQVAHEGGIEIILHAMQCHLAHPRLQYNACGALRNLLVQGSRDFSVASQITAARAGELPPLPGAAPRKAVPKPGGSVRAVLPGGGVGRGRGSLRAVRSSPEIQRRMTEIELRRPGYGRAEGATPSLSRRDMMGDVTPGAPESVLEQALSLTLRSMVEHADQALVQEYGCGTLWNLMMATPHMRARVAEEAGVKPVLAAMDAHPTVTGVQLNACAVLKELAACPPGLKQLQNGGARDALLAATQRHPFNQELTKLAEETMHYLPV